MNQEDVAVIIVFPLSHPPLTKGKECECERCHTAAWVSDTSIDAVKEATPTLQIKYICFECFGSFTKENQGEGAISLMPLSKGQVEEILKKIRK